MIRKAVLARVSGRVQGVGFRYFTLQSAQKLGVTGYVRNLPDGSVEAFIQGEAGAVEACLAALGRGPSFSHVDRVEITEADIAEDHPTFRIR